MKPRKPLSLPGIDGPAVLREASRGGASPGRARPPRLPRSWTDAGRLAMLSGCSLSDNESAEKALGVVSRWNDRVQAGCSTPTSSRPPIRNR